MVSNRLAFASLGIVCAVAAAGGGYLATRQNVADPSSAASPAIELQGSSMPSAQPVQETEAIIGDAKPSQTRQASAAEPVVAKPAATAPRRAPQPAKTIKPAATSPSARAHDTQLPTLDRSWPTSASAPQESRPADSTSAGTDAAAAAARQPGIDDAAAEPSRAADSQKAAAKSFEELVVSADSVIGLQMDSSITSERARVEDQVEARVVRDVRVGNEVAIPAGSQAIGSVTLVERGGKFKERARLGIRFHTLVLADGTRLQIKTDAIYRNGDAPSNASAAKIGGGAVGGAILGAILGGAKGAAVGAAAGAGGGAAAVAAGGREAATFPAGSQVTAKVVSPVTVTIEK
jgi:type IV secretory pathway VirB10-like protein